MRKAIIALLATGLLAACGGGRDGLRDLRSTSGGPDEFSVLPVKPLELPETTELPAPTPGGANRTDPTPNADAVAALGGRSSAAQAGGIPAADAALVSHAGRAGVTPGIRDQLAREDAQFRRRKSAGRVFNIFGRDRYFRAYAGQALDAYAELQRFRNLGVQTPTAPPAE